jgi:hypothetical protein
MMQEGANYDHFNGMDSGLVFNKMQLKAQYAATGDHNSQDMSLIQRMMGLALTVIADGYVIYRARTSNV